MLKLAALRCHLSWLCLALLFGGFLMIRIQHHTLLFGDQSVYFYAAKLWTEGFLPHTDFFLAHNAIQLINPAAIFILPFTLKTKLTLLHFLPTLYSLLSGALIYLTARTAFPRMWSVLTTFFFLFSYSNLVSGMQITGQEIATLLLLLSTLLFLKKKERLSSIILGIAISVSPQLLLLVPFYTLILRKEKKRSWDFHLSLVVTWLIIHLFFVLISGKEFLEQVYLFHFLKPASSIDKWEILYALLKVNAELLLLAFIGIFFFLNQRINRSFLLNLSLWNIAVFGGFLLLYQSIFPHYFLPLTPFLSIVATYSLKEIIEIIRIPAARVALIFVVLMTTFFGNINELWKSIEYKQFDHADDIARYVRNNLPPDKTIYGDFGVAPLIALLSERKISANEVDTNPARFTTGVSDLQTFITRVEVDAGAFITRPTRGLGQLDEFREYLYTNYALAKTFGGNTSQLVQVWMRK